MNGLAKYLDRELMKQDPDAAYRLAVADTLAALGDPKGALYWLAQHLAASQVQS